MVSERVTAPWTEEQVAALNEYQHSGCFHPYTCPFNSGACLVATREGWVCEHCGYTQDWMLWPIPEVPILGRKA